MIIQVNSFLYQYFMTAKNFAMKSDNDDDDNWGEGMTKQRFKSFRLGASQNGVQHRPRPQRNSN